mgnify:CR=1 FL=1
MTRLSLLQTSPFQIVVYLIGLLLMLSVLLIGPELEPKIKQQGLSEFLALGGWQADAWLFAFVFLFPLGLVVCTVAGMLVNGPGWRVVLVAIGLSIAVTSLVVIWPALIGRDADALYFGVGGTLLLILISGTGWHWALQRQQTLPSQRRAVDYRGFAYFCFATATWHICGAGGMPGFAIYPDSVIGVKHYPFIISQFKVVMLYLILAWGSLFLSFRSARKSL